MPEQLELDILDGDEEDVVPYRYRITSYGADLDVAGLIRRMKNGDIYVPPFQRGFVWTLQQASKFVESLLLGLPVPGIFLAKEADTEKLRVVDGSQRLRSLQSFYEGEFPPSEPFESKGVQMRYEGKTYANLGDADRRALDNSIIHATIVRQDEPDDGESSIYQIFERLNTAGTLLSAQEIRAVQYHGALIDLLEELNKLPPWRRLIGPKDTRLRDQELILRFFALYYLRSVYRKPMRSFLNNYAATNRHLVKQSSLVLTDLFSITVDFMSTHLSPTALKTGNSINAATLDATMIGTSERLKSGPIQNPGAYLRAHMTLLTDPEFKWATEAATSDETRVSKRMELATAAFATVE